MTGTRSWLVILLREWIITLLSFGILILSMEISMGWHDSIKEQQPDHPDSLIKQIRAKRVNVSNMSKSELESHMIEESNLRRRLSRAKGLPDVLPAPDTIDNKSPVATRDATSVARGHL